MSNAPHGGFTPLGLRLDLGTGPLTIFLPFLLKALVRSPEFLNHSQSLSDAPPCFLSFTHLLRYLPHGGGPFFQVPPSQRARCDMR